MQDLAELKPGTHRSDADGDHLRRQAAVNAGGALESERKNEKRPGRCAGSPRCCREGRGVRRRPNGDAIVVVMAWPELRNGDVDVDIRAPWLDFLHPEMEGDEGVLVVLSGRQGAAGIDAKVEDTTAGAVVLWGGKSPLLLVALQRKRGGSRWG
jgi:hypothetical protein